MKFILTTLLFFICQLAVAQVAINTTGNNPAPSAMLDVSSTNKGLLMPRMKSAQRNAIQSPDKGLLVFDTDRETIYYFNGHKWRPMMTAAESSATLVSRQVQGAKNLSGFGTSADMYENYAVIGAPNDSAKGVTGGAVYVFVRDGGSWQQVAKLSAPSPLSGEEFGKSVSIYNDLIVVGAPSRTVSGASYRGAVYVFRRTIRIWNFVKMLSASNGAANDLFGTAVATNGTYIVTGAPFTDHSGKTDAGSIYVFGLQNNVWTQKLIINASDPASSAYYGKSVDLWQTKLIVGAPNATVLRGTTPVPSGAAYFYNNTDASGFTWVLGQKLFTGSLHENMQFGASVAIDNNQLICGAPQYSGMHNQYTKYHVGGGIQFVFENGSWKEKLILGSSNDEAKSGTSVAITNGAWFTGMPNWKEARGKVMMFTTSPWVIRYYYDEDPNLENSFGSVVAAHNGHFLVTSPKDAAFSRVFFGVVD
jgi:hypothetical protein